MNLIGRVLALTDTLRLAEEPGPRRGWYKEWFHFCIMGPEIRAVVNFSLMNRPGALGYSRQARVTVLVEEAGAWDGEVFEIDPREVSLSPGRVDLRFGHNSLALREGLFRISAALDQRPITVDLQLRPLTYPLMRNRAPIGAGVIDWLVLPRLQASGVIVVDRRVHRLEQAPAYHDHNWGSWLWGHDFAWQWGFALPTGGANPWSLVYECMTDRARSQAEQIKLCLWKGPRLARIFSQQEVLFRPEGFLPPRNLPKFPPVMALISPERTTDVPRRLLVEAVSAEDRLEFCFEAKEVAQILIPNETDLGETVINEVVGKIRASGRIKDENVEIEGEGFFEFLA